MRDGNRASVWMLAVLLLGACASGGDGNGAAASHAQSQDDPAPLDPDVVRIPKEPADALNEWLGRGTTVLADTIEVDLTRMPFLPWSTFNGTTRENELPPSGTDATQLEGRLIIPTATVRRIEESDPGAGLYRVTLQNRLGSKLKSEMPHVRIGDGLGGLELLATDSIVLRFWSRQSKQRPVTVSVVATGDAVVFLRPSADAQPQRLAGTQVTLAAEVVDDGAGYVFRAASPEVAP